MYEEIVGAFQAALGVVADRLTELGALRPGLDRDAALDRLWFYFGQSALPALVRDRGWSLEQAQQWLTARAAEQLLLDHET